jgi:hypothetical protein
MPKIKRSVPKKVIFEQTWQPKREVSSRQAARVERVVQAEDTANQRGNNFLETAKKPY